MLEFILIASIVFLLGVVGILIKTLCNVCDENDALQKHRTTPPVSYFVDDQAADFGTCTVYGKSDFGNTLVKKFTCTDNPEFARLLADELCEKLNEK